MREFKSKRGDFISRTRRRVIIEIAILVLLAAYFWSAWSEDLPGWLEVSILVIFVAYILFGLASYTKAKAIAEEFSVQLMDDSLGFPNKGNLKQIPYRDLKISKVKKKNDEVVEICLKTTFGQSIKLQGLENMKELYESIAARAGHNI